MREPDIPSSVSGFGESVFRWSPIKTLVIRGTFPDGFRDDTFCCMDDEVVIYVQQSEMGKLYIPFSVYFRYFRFEICGR